MRHRKGNDRAVTEQDVSDASTERGTVLLSGCCRTLGRDLHLLYLGRPDPSVVERLRVRCRRERLDVFVEPSRGQVSTISTRPTRCRGSIPRRPSTLRLCLAVITFKQFESGNNSNDNFSN